jgi:uncharacterized damage-inducible protein DinB
MPADPENFDTHSQFFGGRIWAERVSEPASDIEVFRGQARSLDHVVRLNLAHITQQESRSQPPSAGNSRNCVLGHLLFVYQKIFPLLGQEPVMERAALDRYRRGSAPLSDSSEAVPWPGLRAAWQDAAKRIDAGLATLSPETLDSPAPFSPSKNPEGTVRSLLAVIFFHQAYHAGQTGILRRLAGKKGAIA